MNRLIRAFKLKHIAKRVAAIDQRLADKPGAYAQQELAGERGALLAALLEIEVKPPVKIRDAKATAERERLIQRRVDERLDDIERFAEKLESSGDYRQAKLWRMQALEAREQVQREFGIA